MLGVFVFLTDFSYARLRASKIVKHLIISKSYKYDKVLLIRNLGSTKLNISNYFLGRHFKEVQTVRTKNLLLVPRLLLDKCNEILVFFDYDLPIYDVLYYLREYLSDNQKLSLYKITENGKICKMH